MMRIKILTIFKEMMSPLFASIVGRAVKAGLIEIELIDIRQFSTDKHHKTDDYAFGGGPGLIMLAQPIMDAMAHATKPPFVSSNGVRILLSPRGERLDQRLVERLAKFEDIVLLCGHYEGIDQRAIDTCIDLEVSIGDFILTGGEPAAIVLVDAIARLVPGVLGCPSSNEDESFSSSGLLEYPQYTHPRVVNGLSVPEILLSGDHAKIAEWKHMQSLYTTWSRRPDLLSVARLTEKEKRQVASFEQNP